VKEKYTKLSKTNYICTVKANLSANQIAKSLKELSLTIYQGSSCSNKASVNKCKQNPEQDLNKRECIHLTHCVQQYKYYWILHLYVCYFGQCLLL